MPIEMIKLRWSDDKTRKIRVRVWYSPKSGLTCDNPSEAESWVWMGIAIPGGPRIYPQDNPRAFFEALQNHAYGLLFKSTPVATVTRQGGEPFPPVSPDPHAVELIEIFDYSDSKPECIARVWYSSAGGLTCDDDWSRSRWVAEGIMIPPGAMVYPQDAPRAFFYGLQFEYSGSYVRANGPIPAPKHGGKPFPKPGVRPRVKGS